MFGAVDLRSEYSVAFEALNERGIKFCLLRDDLDHGASSGDLDMLVDDDRFEEALEVFQQIGYCVRVTERCIPFKTVLVRYTSGHFLVVDLHRRLVQNGIVYMDHRSVLSRSVPVADYYLPADCDLLAILVFHNIIGKRRIQSKHYSQIRALVGKVEHEGLRESVKGYGTYSLLRQIIEEVDAYYRDPARAEWGREQIIKKLRRVNRRFLHRRVALGLRRRWRRYDLRSRSPLYALVGVDGCGKTSLSAAIVELLNRQVLFPAVVQYMGPWGHHNLRFVRNSPYTPGWSLTIGEWLAGLVRTETPKRFQIADTVRLALKSILGRPFTEEEKEMHRIVREHSRFYLTLRLLRSLYQVSTFFALLTAEMYYRYWLIYRYRRRGTIVIADRYIYDLMTGGMHQSIPHYRRIRRWLCRLFFRPTRVFLLRADPGTILARKGDLSPEVLRDFQSAYDELAEEYSFEIVESNDHPHKLARNLVERHFEELARSLRT
jgi:thymidylate kinase